MASLATAFFFRRHFFGAMRIRYENLCTFLPPNVAYVAAVDPDNADLKRVFRARRRYTVCLCADWRDFQGLASQRDPEFVSDAFERFYDVVLSCLDAACLDSNYYMDWNADELFVVFYGSTDEASQVAMQALAFAEELCTTLFERVRAECAFDLLYDVGLAAGEGLIGLMGPRKRKKTTVAAAAAGTAKRLETEAKLRRKSSGTTSPYPFLARKRPSSRSHGHARDSPGRNLSP